MQHFILESSPVALGIYLLTGTILIITTNVDSYELRKFTASAGVRQVMSEFDPPLEEIRFARRVVSGLRRQTFCVGAGDADDILAAAARFAKNIFLPLSSVGDREGCRFENGRVTTPTGFTKAYQSFVHDGWNGVGIPARLGGQGLPFSVALAVSEIFNASNISLAMGVMPSAGAVELIDRFGTERQRQDYLPQLVSGDWTVTMALTEPQAGSDLGAIRTRAIRDGDSFILKGQKTLITWGEHDLSKNIIHLVLARSPNGPPGTKGLSLYIVPKRCIVNGELADPNDVICSGIENKIGLRGSPTTSLLFGEGGGARAELLGAENRGLEQMFILMNQARLKVAAFALGSAERAHQAASKYAEFRIQGRDTAGRPSPIAQHPDVRRMLTSMEARTEAIRLAVLYTASLVDVEMTDGVSSDDPNARQELELLTPIIKAWCTESAFDVASLGMQVFGGVGYSEECEASQHFRESRVHIIYEGATGVQANDLILRKVRRDGGVSAERLFCMIETSCRDAKVGVPPELLAVISQVECALQHLRSLTSWIVAQPANRTSALQFNGAHYLMLFGTVLASWLSLVAARASLSLEEGDSFKARKVRNAKFIADQFLPPAMALAGIIMNPDNGVFLQSDNALELMGARV